MGYPKTGGKYEIIDLVSQVSAPITSSGTGVNLGEVIKQVNDGIVKINGSFDYYKYDPECTIDLSAHLSQITSIGITRKGAAIVIPLSADDSGAVLSINRNDDLDDSTPFYFEVLGR